MIIPERLYAFITIHRELRYGSPGLRTIT